MAQHKLSGGVEDLTFGMGTEQQQRQGAIYVITQIHAGVIPYSSTQSITQKIDQMDAVVSSTRTDLTAHKNADNPHNITPEDVNAAPVDHTHPESDIDGLTADLDNKSDVGHTHPTSEVVDLDTQLGNKSPVGHQHAISDVADLQDELDGKAIAGESFLKTEHVVGSAGGADAGKPIVLDNAGKLDPSIAGSGLVFVAMFTPTAGTEYPDDTGYGPGNYWGIDGVDAVNGYTMVGGDLAGTVVFNGDALVIGIEEWGVVHVGIDPNTFYPLDGSVAISAPFAGGGQQIKNIAAGTEAGDALSYEQVAPLLDAYLPLTGGTMAGDIDIGEGNSLLLPSSITTDLAQVKVIADPINSLVEVIDINLTGADVFRAVTVSYQGAEAVRLNTDGTVTAHGATVQDSHLARKDYVDSAAPIGGIIMFSGLLAEIPSNWALCDGTNGTPDLLEKFVRGAINDSDVGVASGNDAANMPTHKHNVSHSHTGSFTGSPLPTHAHSYDQGMTYDTINSPQGEISGTDSNVHLDSTNTTEAISAGTPSGSVAVDFLSIDTDDVAGVGNNIPAYRGLFYIMRLS